MCIDESLNFSDAGTCQCEYDCKNVCIGCDKYFCEIKNEFDLDHEKELPTSECTNSGDHYCHIDCFRDCH